MMSRDPAAIFLITIDPRDTCSMHHKYSKWLTKYEEEQQKIEKKRLEEQEL